MIRKHPKIDQLNGFIKDPYIDIQNAMEVGGLEDAIEIYLKTGKLRHLGGKMRAVCP